MTKWVLGLVALGAVTAAVALNRPKPSACPACALPPPAEPGPPPAPAAAPVVDVVDLEREFDRAARADEPFVPFDLPTAPPPRPVR